MIAWERKIVNHLATLPFGNEIPEGGFFSQNCGYFPVFIIDLFISLGYNESNRLLSEVHFPMNPTPTRRHGVTFGRILGASFLYLFLLLSFLCWFAAAWYVRVYGNTGFDSVIYTLTGGMNGVGGDLVRHFLLHAALPALLTATAVTVLLLWRGRPVWKLKNVQLFPLKRWVAGVLAAVLGLGVMTHGFARVGMIEYFVRMGQESELYQEEYRDPNTVNITFPEQKRNLIYIMLESMETSYLSQDMGGALPYNLIPELTQLAQENINFSHNETVGGFRETPGASWTVGAMVAHTAGVPLKVPEGIADWQNGYGGEGEFLPGLTSLNSILHEQGYYQALMVGSDASFGGRETYFDTHKIDKIYDLYTAWYDGTVPLGYWNKWWGFEDEILFDYAKKELTAISKQEQPFAFTMLTVDTHHIGGYTCQRCGSNYEESYENAIACSSALVYEFVQWIMQQPFFDNTTIIITGDHCSMDRGYFSRNVADDYVRHVYNCFINAAATPSRTQNRQFCAMDMFPTTLAAMGCTIEGDRLGLGTNLFSRQPTLMERMGYERLYVELSKRSEYYSSHFYGAIQDAVPTNP